jgi:hypothetical protein
MLDESKPYVHQGQVFESKEAMELFIASRTVTRPGSSIGGWSFGKVMAIIAALFVVTCTANNFRSTNGNTAASVGSEPLSFDRKYPGAWSDAQNQSIMRTLIANSVSGCGEYWYKAAAGSDSEYLVYCTRDGKNWTTYLVWPKIGNIIGPNKISPEIAPPR